MKRHVAFALLFALTLSVASAQKLGDPSPEPPPPPPLSLRIIGSGRATIDLGGRTPAAYRAGVKAGTITPSPLSCDLKVKVTNRSKNPLMVRLSGPAPELSLSLTGKGEVVTRNASRTPESPSYVNLPPGSSTVIPLSSLSSFKRTTASHLLPLEAGDYQLTATLRTYVYGGRGGRKAKGAFSRRRGPSLGGKNPHVLKTTAPFLLKITAK